MQFNRFRYEVFAEVEITGLDLVVLEYHADRHYDGTCQRFFQTSREWREYYHDGNLWLSRFGQTHDGPPLEALDAKIVVEMRQRTADLCLKIIERLGFTETNALLRDLGWPLVEGEARMEACAANLRRILLDVHERIGARWKALDEEEGSEDA